MRLTEKHLGYLVNLIPLGHPPGCHNIGFLRQVPKLSKTPYDEYSGDYVLEPGASFNELWINLPPNLQRFEMKRTCMLERLVKEKGKRQVFPYLHIESTKNWIFLGALENPRTKWLDEFEELTKYDPEKIKAYIAGLDASVHYSNWGDILKKPKLKLVKEFEELTSYEHDKVRAFFRGWVALETISHDFILGEAIGGSSESIKRELIETYCINHGMDVKTIFQITRK